MNGTAAHLIPAATVGVVDPATNTTIEAANPTTGVGHFSYEHVLDNDIVEIWRLGNIDDNPKAPS